MRVSKRLTVRAGDNGPGVGLLQAFSGRARTGLNVLSPEKRGQKEGEKTKCLVPVLVKRLPSDCLLKSPGGFCPTEEN